VLTGSEIDWSRRNYSSVNVMTPGVDPGRFGCSNFVGIDEFRRTTLAIQVDPIAGTWDLKAKDRDYCQPRWDPRQHQTVHSDIIAWTSLPTSCR
jgi:hypothetical protein